MSSTLAEENSRPPILDEERRELEAVAGTLAGSSRLLRLLTYIAEKYFNGEADQLHEYQIATEVFGRSKTTFNAAEDAIVRVEAHRLRKRLKLYYETEGKDHSIQLSLPPGGYLPVFTHCQSALALPQVEAVPPPARGGYGVAYAVAAAVLVLSCAAGYWLFFLHSAPNHPAGAAPAATAAAVVTPSGMAYADVPLRIMAGYSGKPQMDSAGFLWQPDMYSHYGGNWSAAQKNLTRTSDPMLFEHWRNGDFSYDIPLRPGVYELHLYFVAIEAPQSGPSTFTVSLNGESILSGFDIESDAMGQHVADERIFRDIEPGKDGFVHLAFGGERGPGFINALEIVPGTPHRQLPIRIATQAVPSTDRNGQFWHPDTYDLGGYLSPERTKVEGTADPDIFGDERYGHFSYAIPVDTRDRYTVVLHFAEFYYGANASGNGGVGSRLFRVECNGQMLLDNFDIFKEAGSLSAITKTFYHLKPTAQGKLNLTFEPIANNATVSGIEVIDEGE